MDHPSEKEELCAVLVGCGAIALSHATAFRTLGVRFETFVDPIQERAHGLAKTLGIRPKVSVDLAAATFEGAHFAVVCSPPWEHARQCLALMDRGLDILCEKPLTLTLHDARTLSDAAMEKGRLLGAAMVRRFFGQSSLLKEIVDNQTFGRATHVRVRESMFGWPLSKGMLEPGLHPVGTLADSGPHVFDLIHWIFGPIVLEAYEDNARQGEDSFCHIVGRAGPATFEVHLMRRLAVAARWTVDFERGVASLNPRAPTVVNIRANGLRDSFKASRPQDPFLLQAESFVAAVKRKGKFAVPLEASNSTAAFIDACHSSRSERPSAAPSRAGSKILVTGGTGNVGNRLAEMLTDRGDLSQYRFLVRNFDNASDLCRLGADIVVGDLVSGTGLDAALVGCRKILHLGAGLVPGRETVTLAAAARRAEVVRFVHFSTANVFGMDLPVGIEELQEATPLKKTGDSYCDGKATAEKAIRKFPDLNPVVVRPHIVYGPGMRWTFDLANQMEGGRLAVLQPEGFANLIFVDDLVNCALLLLDDQASGAFFVTDGVATPWDQYLDRHTEGLGYARLPRRLAGDAVPQTFIASLRASGRALRGILASDTVRTFITEDPLAKATLFRFYLASRSLGPVRQMRDTLHKARAAQNVSDLSPQWLNLQASRARLSAGRLTQATGFQAMWSFEKGTDAAIAWLKARGY